MLAVLIYEGWTRRRELGVGVPGKRPSCGVLPEVAEVGQGCHCPLLLKMLYQCETEKASEHVVEAGTANRKREHTGAVCRNPGTRRMADLH